MIDGKILIIDDNKSVLSALEILLQFEYKHIETLSNPNQISSFKNLIDFDIVLLDMNFLAGVNNGNEGLYWLKEIKKKAPDISVIMITSYGAIDLAVDALKAGASDFILKPWNNDKLLSTIKSVYLLKKSLKERNKPKTNEKGLKEINDQNESSIIGNSKELLSLLHLTQKVAKTDVSVLITGENGTGKEVIAQELHRLSNRKNEIFISVDMGSISESLFESELFGHMKGAFTDAKQDRIGKFEAANGGTLFLDEIGNLSLQLQAKLLSVLQNRIIVRVGSNKPIPVNIRLVCATNCNLHQMVADGVFREDLLYRINTIHLEVPSLRDRDKDILLLADFYLKKMSSKYDRPDMKIDVAAQEKLMAYSWPGNVRELQHTIERAIILCESNVLKPDDFLLINKSSASPNTQPNTLDEMEEIMINRVLNENNSNLSAAANQLGVSRQTLYNKIKKRKSNG
ncbi:MULTISPECIES: sigma-54-dependent transcriptional regulator [Flavobacterium]|uniref:Sigma-54-dependent Fis family transcriptional regulator n=1 Tax=Flavobacterium panici TaxID=2654843 RepID=A0A9N8P2X1_9FLAO|nr:MULTISPECIES: sigma-54 dependent transcriptional regulator [Flavobacterium]UUF16695.1 sigma-54 dependent transcriptional regulator [Flavobacterium panici]CAC9975499.1 sigma-54-dependent Fis family transcriptional regulator [Flavobacterium panici]